MSTANCRSGNCGSVSRKQDAISWHGECHALTRVASQ